MFAALVLSAAVLGSPAGAPAPAAASQDDPAIRIWLNDDGRYQRGDPAKVQVKTRDDGYLLVLNVDPDGRLRVLFPLDPGDDAFVRGGKKYELQGRGGREAFEVSARSGHGTVYAAVSRDPFRFDGYVVGDHWDFGALDDVRISDDKPEPDLNQFVQRLARTDFDYDLLGYDVYESVVYGGGQTAYVDSYGPTVYTTWDPYASCYWYCGGSSIFIGVGLGHRYYDPFFYSPFYSPYYYNPYYYSPYYAYPTFYYPVYHYPRPFHYYPYYPYAYGSGRPYYGGYFANPWRNRVNDPVAPGGFQWWRGRGATSGNSTTLASAYRGRFNQLALAPRGRVPTATPVRGTVATTDAGTQRRRSLDMTPARIEPSGAQASAGPAGRAPEGRRAIDRRQPMSASVPERVRSQGQESRPRRAERAEPVRAPVARPAGPELVNRRDGGEAIPARRADDRSGYEGPRIIESRAPEPRRAADDRPASRPNIDSRRMESSEPVRMDRGGEAPPQIERRAEPAPRMERGSEPAPRRDAGRSSEPQVRERGNGGGGRAAPAPRGDGGSRGGGWRR